MTRTLSLTLATAVLALGSLAGCAEDDEPSTKPTPTTSSSSTPTPSGSPSATATPTVDGVVIRATIRGDELDPNGERVKVPLGEPITIVVDADRAGELHVHSAPEQELEYGKGITRVTLDPITIPGIIEVEDHVADKLLVSLEVS